MEDYQAAQDATSFYDADEGFSTCVSPCLPLSSLIDIGYSQGRVEYALLNTAFLEFEAGGYKAAREVSC